MRPGPNDDSPPLGRPAAARLGFFVAAYLAAAEFGHFVSFTTNGAALTPVWPASGLLLAVLALSKRRYWGVWLLAAFGANVLSDVVLHGRALVPGFSAAAAYCLEAAIGAWLLEKLADRPFSTPRVADVIALSVAGVMAAAVGGALVGATANAAGAAFGPAFLISWFGDAVGVIAVAPMLFAWRAEAARQERIAGWRLVELTTAFLGVIVTMTIVTGGVVPLAFRAPAFVLPFLLWASYRFEMTGAALSAGVGTLIAFWNTSQGRGPYFVAGSGPSDWALRAQSTMGVAAICIYLLACVVAERRRTARERDALVANLQQALAEIKTLQGMIPICAWCHKIRDDAGFWQRIEGYLHDHTEATFSHGICPDCSKDMDARPGPPH